jgi:cytochrome o ubiquinol oxidase subunit 2
LVIAHRVFRGALSIVPALVVSGCGLARAPVLDPHGPIALTERDLLFTASGLMLIVVVPVFVLTFLFVRRYRSSNTRSRYLPEWSYSARLDATVWLVPAIIVTLIGCLVWIYTHKLDAYRQSAGAIAPLEVEVVAEDWKWLFIYPGQNIAAANELVFPSDRPLRLELTSDTVMNSFYIPGLAGQIYAMAGMRTELNLRADGPADFVGRNMQYSGLGFAGQHFAARAASSQQFDEWVAKAKRSPNTLDTTSAMVLSKSSGKVAVSYFSSVEPHLFADIIEKYSEPSMTMRHGHELPAGASIPSGAQ